ncbi:hypothetical protein [Nocardioides iriomotensis]|uniref:Lipoprotein n=1 Tax=Nocardioides iriomotensis TaxID=715784 RepID=A0A4Q5IXV2_9ACTN|nr:hypothetical protein [Nocardioides iriomotensis]RYU10990.1 hypothetical protein ETU37_14875 [Nocardioides iriomotensis]
MQREDGRSRLCPTRLAVLLMAGVMLAACTDSLEPRQPDGPGVTGRMVLLDDTGRPPTSASGGGILVLPEAALPGLWRRVGEQELDGRGASPYASFHVEVGLVADLDGEIAPVDENGHFRLSKSGRYLICRTGEIDRPGEHPVSARGCDLVQLPESGALEATFGEGGFHARILGR